MGHPDGWWRASDGNWYPPESHPGSQPSSEAPPIYRQPWLLGALAAIVVLVIAVVVTTPGKKKTSFAARSTTTTVGGSSTTFALAPVAGGAPAATTSSLAVPTTAALPASSTVVPTLPPPGPPIVTVPVTPPPTSPATSPPTAPPTTPLALCGAPPNPMGYNFCGRGTLVYRPDPQTCGYFSCIAGFERGTGYLVECRDGLFSLSGGHAGTCSYHGGVLRPVFSGT